METNNGQHQSPVVSSSTHSSSSLLKKTSPLKHVTPIIKKYDYQRQAKNGKSAKLKTQGKIVDQEQSTTNPTLVQDFVAGMDSLDAALRRAEQCLAGRKDLASQADYSLDSGMEPNGDDLGDIEEEGILSSNAASNQPNSVGNRSAHLRRNRVLKKRNQLQKDLDHALPLAAADLFTLSKERCNGYAASYFQKVRERFEIKNRPIFDSFMQMMEDLSKTQCVTDLYHRVLNLFEGHPDLCEEFLLFLLPKQAIQCGKFMEHLALTEMSSFLRKLELCFVKQPQHLRKIHTSWARLAETPDITLETVRSTILPLLRGNTFLVDSFLELLPSEKPPESKMTDFDILVCDDNDSEHSGEEETFEKVEIPPENDDRYGGESCQCCCHSSSSPAYTNRMKHCMACGIKFISGKVFMQTEHGLRPVKIDFTGGTMGSNIKRLNKGHQKLSRPRSRRGRTNTSQIAVRSEDGKPTVETDDEATFSKVKSPHQRPKISKPVGEKVSSSRSLSLGRTKCARRTINCKAAMSPQPLLSDQEAIAAPGSSGDEKKPVTDVFNLSNIPLMDLDKNEKKGQFVNNICDANQVPTLKVEHEMKEEDMDGMSSAINKENNEPKELEKGRKQTVIDLVMSEESVPEDNSMSESDERAEEAEGSLNASGASSDCEVAEVAEGASWTRDEDRIILCTFQSEPDKGKTLEKINLQLPHRTVDEISNRFNILMSLIQQMR